MEKDIVSAWDWNLLKFMKEEKYVSQRNKFNLVIMLLGCVGIIGNIINHNTLGIIAGFIGFTGGAIGYLFND